MDGTLVEAALTGDEGAGRALLETLREHHGAVFETAPKPEDVALAVCLGLASGDRDHEFTHFDRFDVPPKPPSAASATPVPDVRAAMRELGALLRRLDAALADLAQLGPRHVDLARQLGQLDGNAAPLDALDKAGPIAAIERRTKKVVAERKFWEEMAARCPPAEAVARRGDELDELEAALTRFQARMDETREIYSDAKRRVANARYVALRFKSAAKRLADDFERAIPRSRVARFEQRAAALEEALQPVLRSKGLTLVTQRSK